MKNNRFFCKKKIGRPLYAAGLFLAFSFSAFAQDINNLNNVSSISEKRERQPRTDWKTDPPKGTPGLHKNRFFAGGGIGLQFGTLTGIELAPTVGYIAHRMFRFGITANFSYFRDISFQPAWSSYFWGGSFFVRFYPIRYFFLHAEIGGMNQAVGLDQKRKWLAYPMAGIGYNQPIGQRVALNLRILWNFNDSEYAIYGNPIIGIGCEVGL